MTNPVQSSNDTPSSTPSLAETIGKLAGIIGSPHYPAGERAALKRWSPGQALPLAFYRLWLRHVGDDLPAERQLEIWMLIAWGLALLGEGAHRPGRPLGQALAEAGFSEARLERLLAAPDALRADLLMNAIRFLAAKGESFDWQGAAYLLLASNASSRERIHRRIARDFYRNLKEKE